VKARRFFEPFRVPANVPIAEIKSIRFYLNLRREIGSVNCLDWGEEAGKVLESGRVKRDLYMKKPISFGEIGF
jgi:hypothetical protein